MNNMKKKLVLFASVAIALASCQTTPKEDYSWIKKGLDVASAQLQLTAEEIDGTGKLPRSIRTGYDMDFLCRLRDNIKTNKEKRCDNGNLQYIFCHCSRCFTHKHLSLQIVHITVNH